MMKDKQFDPAHAAVHGYRRADWEDVCDNPEWTAEDFATAKPVDEMFPELAKSIGKARERPPVAQPRQQISIRLDPDVILKFKATGRGWQARINEVLKRAKI